MIKISMKEYFVMKKIELKISNNNHYKYFDLESENILH